MPEPCSLFNADTFTIQVHGLGMRLTVLGWSPGASLIVTQYRLSIVVSVMECHDVAIDNVLGGLVQQLLLVCPQYPP